MRPALFFCQGTAIFSFKASRHLPVGGPPRILFSVRIAGGRWPTRPTLTSIGRMVTIAARAIVPVFLLEKIGPRWFAHLRPRVSLDTA